MRWYWWLLLLGGGGLGAWYFLKPKTVTGGSLAGTGASTVSERTARKELGSRTTGGAAGGAAGRLGGAGEIAARSGGFAGGSMLGGIWDSWKDSIGF